MQTIDSIRNTYIMDLNVQFKSQILLVGPTGTGKTINAIGAINQNYSNENYANLITSFSGKTTCNQIQR